MDSAYPQSSIRDYLLLDNPGPDPTKVSVDFILASGGKFSRQVELRASSNMEFEINEWIGFNGSCDMIAVHPYKSPKFWGAFYTNIVNTLQSIGADKEVVITEVGWPSHSDHPPEIPDPFNEQYQTEAIGDLGVGGLFEAGCRKIWILRDFDEDPGAVWDGNYYGLWKHTGQARPAWNSYVSWQRELPRYSTLSPSSL